MIIEADLPRGSRVGSGNDFAVAEGQFPTFRGGRFSLHACSAKGLIIEVNDPLVSRVLACARSLLSTDRL